MQQKKKFIIGVSLLYLLASGSGFAAEKVLINKTPGSIGELPLLPDTHFGKEKEIHLANGQVRYKLAQFYKSVPVWDAAVVATKDNLRDITDTDVTGGSFLKGIDKDLSDVTPTIDHNQAIEIAKSAHQVISTESHNENAHLYIKNHQGKAKLVYVVDFLTDEDGPSRPFSIIDAHSGQVLHSWEGLTTADAKGPGGNEKTGKYFYGSDGTTQYGPLVVTQSGNQCSMDSPNVATYDMKGQKSGETLFKFTCFENNYKAINGAFSPINDAHYFGNVVYDMYKQWFNAAPLKFKLKMRVHYDQNYDNAFWDGSQMTFGDGASMFYPLVAQDVVGHEVSHGFTEQNSGLVYENMSGGMNEAFSDMAGQATQYFSNKGKNDWMVGDDITKGPKGKAMRYFEDPTKDGYSIGHAKDYTPGMEVHGSSGVYNRAFYLLAHKDGWDTKKAFEVFVTANQLYWTQNSTFDQGGCGVYTAAKDLKYNTDHVIEAFKTVGVDANCDANPNPNPNPDPNPNPNPNPDPNPNPNPNPDPCPPTPCPDPNPTPCPDPNPNPWPYPDPNPNPWPYPDPNPNPWPYPDPNPNPWPYPDPNPNPWPWPYPDDGGCGCGHGIAAHGKTHIKALHDQMK